MIVGIGTDIIEIDRVKTAVEKNPRFISKYFTSEEQELFTNRKYSPHTVAGNFAAKESISKALGTGFREFGLKDIEILRDSMGKPYANLYGQAKLIQEKLGIDQILVTISHCRSHATAYVIAERNE